MFSDKYQLSDYQNLFVAKKTFVESIYHTARLEGVNITFPDTKTIIEGVSVGGLNMDDVNKIINLKRAWHYMLQNLKAPFDLNFAKQIHNFIGYMEALEWGKFRNGEVGINGVNYKPPIPKENIVQKEFEEICKIDIVTERAITYMLWSMRSQLFWDGNKRTAIICANKLLIANGNGVLVIKEEDLPEFNRRLTAFYESGDYNKINRFIYEKCIHGLTFSD